MQAPEDLEDFVCKEVESLCDADPKVLAQYITALIRNEEPNDALKASLQEKLNEFFDVETMPFIDRLFAKINEGQPSEQQSSGRFHDYSDEEDDGDRNFKHRRQRSESREDRTNIMDQDRTKRRYQDDNNSNGGGATKYFRNDDYRRGGPPSGPASMYNGYDNRSARGGRGRGGGSRGGGMMGRTGQPRAQCRDYNEKGFCMRGDMCPYDHGMDRIIVDESGSPYPGSFPNNPMNTMGRPQPPFFGIPGMMPTSTPDAYDPERAGLMAPSGSMTGFPDMGMMNPADMSMMTGGGNAMRNSRPRGGGRGGGRGGLRGRHHYQSNNPLNTTLTVEKIPLEYCQISTVNDFFAKFGNITNISVQPHQQKAIIQYGSRAEAEAAYNSPDAIFDNRFVKVYWHKDESTSTAPAVPEPPKSNEPDPELVAARAAELAKEREEKQKKHNERMKHILELQKQKEHLLQLQIAEQKRLLSKLTDSASLTAQEKEELLKALKKIQSEIDMSRASAVAPAAAPVSDTTAAVSTSVTTEESTDASKPESSEDLKKKLARLELEAATLGIQTSGARGGRGGYFARGSRGGWPRMRGGMTRMSLDNRPTKIQIKNIPEETTEADLRQHFEQFGYMTLFEKSETEASVQYSQRFEAEKAMAGGASFPKGELELNWVAGGSTTAVVAAPNEEKPEEATVHAESA
ncbi:hypothetical protein K501DRAFT_260452 [Backusella circina FSU 941]|nr:hypothetical protein K501DRAFT_260452 [Backusella circina FSU 941]